MALWTAHRWPFVAPSTKLVRNQSQRLAVASHSVHRRLDVGHRLFRRSPDHLGFPHAWHCQTDQRRLVADLLHLMVEKVQFHRHVIDRQHRLRLAHVHRPLPYAHLVSAFTDPQDTVPSAEFVLPTHLSAEASARADRRCRSTHHRERRRRAERDRLDLRPKRRSYRSRQ